MQAYIAGISVWAPGLNGWEASRPILAGQQKWVEQDVRLPIPSILSATERRRTSHVVRLALTVASQAIEMAGVKADQVRCIFGTGNGDSAVLHQILQALTGPEQYVSPTQFHNSVHNAAAGYWTIGTRSHAAATSIGCHDFTVAACLLKAVAELRVEHVPVLLCLYDTPLPPPLCAVRPTSVEFAAGLVLTPRPISSACALMSLNYVSARADAEQEKPRSATLRSLAEMNPAARALRLLEILARPEGGTLSLALLDGRIDIDVQPCSTEAVSSS